MPLVPLSPGGSVSSAALSPLEGAVPVCCWPDSPLDGCATESSAGEEDGAAAPEWLHSEGRRLQGERRSPARLEAWAAASTAAAAEIEAAAAAGGSALAAAVAVAAEECAAEPDDQLLPLVAEEEEAQPQQGTAGEAQGEQLELGAAWRQQLDLLLEWGSAIKAAGEDASQEAAPQPLMEEPVMPLGLPAADSAAAGALLEQLLPPPAASTAALDSAPGRLASTGEVAAGQGCALELTPGGGGPAHEEAHQQDEEQLELFELAGLAAASEGQGDSTPVLRSSAAAAVEAAEEGAQQQGSYLAGAEGEQEPLLHGAAAAAQTEAVAPGAALELQAPHNPATGHLYDPSASPLFRPLGFANDPVAFPGGSLGAPASPGALGALDTPGWLRELGLLGTPGPPGPLGLLGSPAPLGTPGTPSPPAPLGTRGPPGPLGSPAPPGPLGPLDAPGPLHTPGLLHALDMLGSHRPPGPPRPLRTPGPLGSPEFSPSEISAIDAAFAAAANRRAPPPCDVDDNFHALMAKLAKHALPITFKFEAGPAALPGARAGSLQPVAGEAPAFMCEGSGEQQEGMAGGEAAVGAGQQATEGTGGMQLAVTPDRRWPLVAVPAHAAGFALGLLLGALDVLLVAGLAVLVGVATLLVWVAHEVLGALLP